MQNMIEFEEKRKKVRSSLGTYGSANGADVHSRALGNQYLK